MWMFVFEGFGDVALAVAASVPMVRRRVVNFMMDG